MADDNTDPMKVPTEYQDNTDSVSEASDVAAKRMQKSVISPAHSAPGTTSQVLFAVGATPLIWSHMIRGTIKKFGETN